MKNKLKTIIRKLSNTPFAIILSLVSQMIIFLQVYCFKTKWLLTKKQKPNKEEIQDVCKNITFIYKSFERQKMARTLYKSIQLYYPGARLIISDDSSKLLDLQGGKSQNNPITI